MLPKPYALEEKIHIVDIKPLRKSTLPIRFYNVCMYFILNARTGSAILTHVRAGNFMVTINGRCLVTFGILPL